MRRAGAIAFALMFGSIAVALYLAHQYRLGLAPTSVAILISGGTLPAVYLAWVAYRDSQVREEVLTLGEIADELAAAVADQWEREAVVRRVNDPYPLPVRWLPADPALSEEWDALVTLASSGAGWPAPETAWATDPSQLAGDGNQLADVLGRVPTGRLVVLGEPGSGKTILMIRLVLDLLQRRSEGDVVPVLVSAASWNPMAQDFHSWLTSQLLIAYPALATPYASDGVGISRVDALLQEKLIMPIIDGFDELPSGARSRAIAEVNGELRPGERLVITSRVAEYRAATRPATGPEITLAAAAVELCPLEVQDVFNYLRQSAGGPRSASRWDRVFSELARSKALTQVLTNPLMVGLARAIYNPKPDEQTSDLPDPAELCTFGNRRSIEDHLLDAFIPAAFRPTRGKSRIRREWNPQLAERWLTFLAVYLERVVREPGFSWWDLNIASPAMTYVVSGFIGGVAVGVPIILIPLLLVTTSLIRVRLAATPGYSPSLFSLLQLVFQQYWERIIEFTILFGAAGGIAGLAVAFGPYQRLPIRSILASWHFRVVMARIPFVLLYGMTYGLITYAIVQFAFDWPGYLDAIVALAVGLASGWTSAFGGFHMNTVAVIVVGAIVGTPFFLYKDVSYTGYGSIGSISLVIGLLAGLAGATVLAQGQNGRYPSRSIRWSSRNGALSGLAIAIAITILTKLAIGNIARALILGTAIGLGAMVIFGLERVPGDLAVATSPTLVLKRDRSATLALCLVTAITTGLAIGIGTFVASTNELLPDVSPISDGLIFGLTIGPTLGFAFGFALSGYGSAWPQWIFTRQILAVRHDTPRRLLTFLEDSHALGVLRQLGPVYQFRHIELQHRLASRVPGKTSPTRLQQVAVSNRWQERQPGNTLRPFAPLNGKRTLRIRRVLRITVTFASIAVVAVTFILLTREVTTRTGLGSTEASTLVPIVTCPTNDGIGGIQPVRYPATKSAPVPPALGRTLAYYADETGFIPTILGPRGWACSASVGADGGWNINIYARVAPSKNSVDIEANGPSCMWCIYTTVCPLIPHAEAEFPSPEGKCSIARTPEQVVSWVVGSPNFSASGDDVVSIVDPPGVKGFVAHSGGPYFARGILLYFWQLPEYYWGNPSGGNAFDARTISCVLPDSDAQLCNAILTTFSHQGWNGG